MLALHPRLVASDAADDNDEDSRGWYYVVVACVSLLLFVMLAAAGSVVRACAITGAALLLLGLVGWFAPTGTRSGTLAMRQQAPAPALGAVRLAHHRCSCGLADAAIGALPMFAFEPPAAKDIGGDDDDGRGKPRGNSVPCAVCLEDVQAGEMVRHLPACRHLFHVDCVDVWLRAHRTCPLCRRELSPLNVTDPSPDELPPV
ncbi:RING-H2 finger protein ATL8-like [Phragmites australis]|uniref:RING-H2 finger protein ATL8-like n=1 Tax=Phragmites australis TaxID=29695 RepID=UPI002D783515|nr:RING-H2 finger protein ATL8-like [Phragmites australis]